MNDLRLPGLRLAATLPSRADALTAPRGATEPAPQDSGFDRSLQRAAERPAEPARRDSAPDRRSEAPRSDSGLRPRDADESRSSADTRADGRREYASTESADAPARDDRDRATPAEGSESPGGAMQSSAVPLPSADTATSFAALVAASAAMSASAAVPTDAATAPDSSATSAGDDALPATAALASVAGATDLTAATRSEAAATAAQAAAEARIEAKANAKAEAKADATIAAGTLPELTADLTRSPAKDRLLEDFERRFESSLARAVGTGALLSSTGPLAAAGLPTQPPPPGANALPALATVATPIGHPSFGNDLSHRVLLLAGQRVQSAEISVSPADLGPISVSIEVRGQEAALQFSAAHATTRAAIEDALPRLREMFAAQGLQLTQADVGDRRPQGQAGDSGSGNGGSRDGGTPSGAGGSVAAVGAAASAAPARRLGLIDIRV